jgi:hypothetical protein
MASSRKRHRYAYRNELGRAYALGVARVIGCEPINDEWARIELYVPMMFKDIFLKTLDGYKGLLQNEVIDENLVVPYEGTGDESGGRKGRVRS